eukprot:6745910-Alexandrium_andersonii.AAC.1
MSASLVGSEMCIRDSPRPAIDTQADRQVWLEGASKVGAQASDDVGNLRPVSYTHLTLPTICSV